MSPTDSEPDATTAPADRNQIRILLTAVFLIYLGQMTLNPIIAPLSREVGLAEWQVGVTISTAAMMLVLTSGIWGRRSQSWGRKPVLVSAFVVATVTMAIFAVVGQLGMTGAMGSSVLFVLFLLFRGIGFGIAIAAVPTTAQAYIADVTTDPGARVRGMAGIGSSQGIAMVAGSLVGGGLATFGLLVPLVAVPVLLAAGLVLLAFRLRREPRTELIAQPRRVRATDPRVWPFLVAGFGMFTALGFIQILFGFIVQDRLSLGPEATSAVTGATILTAGVAIIVAQGIVVPRSGWTPPRLLRVGAATALVGFTMLALDAGPILLFIATGVTGLGLGIAMPGYQAGPTLAVGRDEQGGVAGLVTATTGLTFVVAPAAGATLYGWSESLPILVAGGLMACVTIFVLLHPRFRAAMPVGDQAPPHLSAGRH